MDNNRIVFDIVEAEKLIDQMSEYCSSLQFETRELIGIIDSPAEWRDYQMQSFQTNLMEIAKDLNEVLKLESDNLNTFYERVMELLG